MNSVELVKEICKERKIPISRLERECGFSNGYIRKLSEGKFPSDRLLKIADYLDLSFEYLMTGIEHQPAHELTARNEKDIEKALQGTLEQLDSQDGLMFDGAAMDPETRELLRLSLENTIRTAKITAKKKFTPKNIRANEDD